MKFGKSLNNQIVETLPEWRDKFLSYKNLKKQLKLIADARAVERQSKRQRVGSGSVGDGGSPPPMTPEEAGFVCLLEAELEKFNAFFLGKEEDYVIRQKELQDRVVRAAETGSAEELMRVGKEIVDFHGEIVLLVNYSALNYTGLVKILKKYDKRTGALIRLPFIQRVLQQPFFTTDPLHKLVKECEVMLDQIIPANEPFVPNEHGNEESDSDEELDEIEGTRSMYMRSTLAALRTLKEIRGVPRR